MSGDDYGDIRGTPFLPVKRYLNDMYLMDFYKRAQQVKDMTAPLDRAAAANQLRADAARLESSYGKPAGESFGKSFDWGVISAAQSFASEYHDHLLALHNASITPRKRAAMRCMLALANTTDSKPYAAVAAGARVPGLATAVSLLEMASRLLSSRL